MPWDFLSGSQTKKAPLGLSFRTTAATVSARMS
jgi:hypothetical protein